MYILDDIEVYIFNWKRVTVNSLDLYSKISPIIKNTCIINCDESYNFAKTIKTIQLDDSHYYGSQYEHAIKNVRPGSILCVIVGDNITNNNFENIFDNAIETFNTINVGVYSPNDKRSIYKQRLENIKDDIYNIENTDCGFWFISPVVVARLRNISYSISKYGWGIDIITIKESRKLNLLVLRDYSVETDQIDHSCGYPHRHASKGMKLLMKEYENQINGS